MSTSRQNLWSRNETMAALHVYMQLPFGQLHSRTPLIKQLASWIGRTPGSVALKLVNLASLDPQILARGRKGMGNASGLDKKIWLELTHDWEAVITQAALVFEQLATNHGASPMLDIAEELDAQDLAFPEGQTRSATVQVRVNQARFRKAVLASYNYTCCISGLQLPKLLVASHIVPWHADRANRLNPRNGLCLSTIHDRAFDQGLITIRTDFTVQLSSQLEKVNDHSPLLNLLRQSSGQKIKLPDRFAPDTLLLQKHQSMFAE